MHLWRSENNLQERVLSFRLGGPEELTSSSSAASTFRSRPSHQPLGSILCTFCTILLYIYSSLCNPEKGNKQRQSWTSPPSGLGFSSQVDTHGTFDFGGNHAGFNPPVLNGESCFGLNPALCGRYLTFTASVSSPVEWEELSS